MKWITLTDKMDQDKAGETQWDKWGRDLCCSSPSTFIRSVRHISLVTEPLLVNVGQINLSITLKRIVLLSILFILPQIPSQLLPFFCTSWNQAEKRALPSWHMQKIQQHNKLVSMLVMTAARVTVHQNNLKWHSGIMSAGLLPKNISLCHWQKVLLPVWNS